MNSFLFALPLDWEERIVKALAHREYAPRVVQHFDEEAEILKNGDRAIVVVHVEDADEGALRFCRRLRERHPTPKVQIVACASTPPAKESWPSFRKAGVAFVLSSDFPDPELEFRLAAAELFSKSDSSTGSAVPEFHDEADVALDTENLPYGEFYSSLGGRFLKVNNGLVNILGYSSKEELMKANLDRDVYFDAEERAWRIATVPSHNITFEVVWKRRDGSPILLQLAGHVVLDEIQHAVFFKGIVWDITEQKRGQEMLRLQRDLGIALSRISSLKEMIDNVLETAIQIEGVDCGGFYLVEEGTRLYRLVASRGLSPEGIKVVAVATPDAPHIRLCEEGKPFYLRNEEFISPVVEWARSEGLTSSGCVPIMHDGKVIATLNLASRTQSVFPQATRLAVEAIATQIGGSIVRVQAEESLRTSRLNLQAVFDAMTDVVLIASMHGRILHFNAAALSSLGYTADELKGKPIAELHPDDFVSEALDMFERGITGALTYGKLPFLAKTGKVLPMEMRVGLGTWAEQQAVFGVFRDCSEREASRKALAESEARFRAIFENASVGIGFSDLTGRLLDVNEAVARMEGLTREEIIGHHFLEFTTPEDGAAQLKLHQDISEGRIQSYEIEKRYFDREGNPFWVRNSSSIVPVQPGEKPQYLISVIENIDAHRRAEQLLRESETRYRLIADNASDVVWSARWTLPDLANGLLAGDDPQTILEVLLRGWRYEYISPSLEKVLGYGVEESMSDTPITHLPPHWHALMAKILLGNLAERMPAQLYEFPMITKDGAQCWCEVTVNIIPTAEGEPLRATGILRDITSRHETQEALRESETHLRILFENLPDIVVLLDRDATIRFVNHGSSDVPAETLLGASIFSFIPEPGASQCRSQLDHSIATKTVQTIEVLTVTGRYWSARIVPMVLEGIEDHAMVICTERTAEKQAAEAIRQEQQLLRQLIDLQERERKYLSYEIHDGFAQQITGALFHLETFKRLRENDELQAERNLNQTAAMLSRSIDETRRLISGLRPPILDEAGILAAIEYLICEHRERSGIDIMFVHDLQAIRLAPPVECAVFRIVQESLTNACRHSGGDFIRVELNESGDRLQVVVFDEGKGFDPASVPDERFGLRSIRERARLLGGEAEIQTAPGEGCRICVDLPLVLAAGE